MLMLLRESFCTIGMRETHTVPCPLLEANKNSEVKIVSEFGKEFNIDEVYNGETSSIGSLKVPPSLTLKFDEKMMEGDVEQQPVDGVHASGDLDLSKPFVGEVLIDGDVQKVEYERLHTICFYCGKYGHLQEVCQKEYPSRK